MIVIEFKRRTNTEKFFQEITVQKNQNYISIHISEFSR